jgi:hypothetical protein
MTAPASFCKSCSRAARSAYEALDAQVNRLVLHSTNRALSSPLPLKTSPSQHYAGSREILYCLRVGFKLGKDRFRNSNLFEGTVLVVNAADFGRAAGAPDPRMQRARKCE